MDLLEKYSVRFLTMRGTNPFKSTITAKMICAASIISYVILFISLIYSTFFTITEVAAVVDNVTGIVVVSQALIKDIGLSINRQKYVHVINYMNEFWRADKFGKMAMKKVKNIRQLSEIFVRIYIWILGSVTVGYILRIAVIQGAILPLTWVNFCDVEYNYCYVLNYIAQSICIIWGMMGILYFDTMSLLLLASAYQELEQIKCGFILLSINETDNEEQLNVLEGIRVLVKQHNRVLDFIDEVGNLLGKLLVSHMLSIIFIVCASLFLLSNTGFPPPLSTSFRIVPYIAGTLGQNFIFCAVGQLIIDQSASVADAAYASRWWVKKQPNLRRAICLTMQRSHRHSQIAVVGIFNLDLNTFVAIVKSSFSILAFVNAIYE